MGIYKNLRKYNFLMGTLHLAQSTLILLISNNNFSLPIVTNYLKFNPQTQTLDTYTEKFADLRIAPLIAMFLFLSAVAHFSLTVPGIYEWYIKNLKKRINYARWIEYMFSSSIMIAIIAMLVGVYDLSSLILIVSINSVMILCGMIMEVHNQTTSKTNWLSFWIGSFAGMVPWIVIALYLFGSGDENSGPPNFVYGIFFTIFLFFNSFAINMYLQYKRVGKWDNYVFGEAIYILLSLLAKSALAWQVYAGTLRPV